VSAPGDKPTTIDGLEAWLRTNGRLPEPEVTDNGAGPHDDPGGSLYRFAAFPKFVTHNYPPAEPLLGDGSGIRLAKGSLLLVYGGDGAGKSTWTIDAAAHLAAGIPWLGIAVPRPVRCLLIENEGQGALFQAKLARKRESWTGPDFAENLHVLAAPWGEFSFADEDARRDLTGYCDDYGVELVMANPTLGLGVAASGRPDETAQFVDWLRECGLWDRRAFWLNHHENKAGQISGDWGRHPDTKVLLRKDGNAQRTKLTWEKTRWATLAPGEREVMLDWVTETEGYTVTPLGTAETVSEDVLVQRLVEYLNDHPATPTATVLANVQGPHNRLTKLLNERPEFNSCPGAKGAKLRMVTGWSAEGEEQ
jgi:hypothetical protein